MTKIYLVRHGAVDNPGRIFYGRLPRFKLDSLGWQQAEQTARFLARERLAAIYSSPQLRARQTAAILARAQPGLTVRVSRLIAEVKSSWQGSDGDALGADFNFYEPRRHPDDEGLDDIARRMRRMIRLVLARHRGQCVACVSHGDPISIARLALAGQPLVFANLRHGAYVAPASLTILEFDSTPEVPQISYLDLSAKSTTIGARS